mgnify:CR=1 FL=1
MSWRGLAAEPSAHRPIARGARAMQFAALILRFRSIGSEFPGDILYGFFCLIIENLLFVIIGPVCLFFMDSAGAAA